MRSLGDEKVHNIAGLLDNSGNDQQKKVHLVVSHSAWGEIEIQTDMDINNRSTFQYRLRLMVGKFLFVGKKITQRKWTDNSSTHVNEFSDWSLAS